MNPTPKFNGYGPGYRPNDAKHREGQGNGSFRGAIAKSANNKRADALLKRF